MIRGLLIVSLFSAVFFKGVVLVSAAFSIVDSRHNLSVSGPGDIKAYDEDKICVFCHTPHHATPQTPLWNRSLTDGVSYKLYESTTFGVTLGTPSGPSRLCLSCHDGTVGLGAVLSIPEGISMVKEITNSSANLGTDLQNDHPFSFAYSDAVAFDSEMAVSPPNDLIFSGGGMIHCTTCHEPHDDRYGMFLAVDNKFSALCTRCHLVEGWDDSSKATSHKTWGGNGNNPWPLNSRLSDSNKRNTVAENGCENCHVPHNAVGKQRLLKFKEEELNCLFACHNGNVSDSGKNIEAQFSKVFTHSVEDTTIGDLSGIYHDPAEDVTYLTGHVECQDCHDPHSANNISAEAPFVSGRLVNVIGRDKYGSVKYPSDYEYEICFKCHGNSNTVNLVVVRYVNTVDNFVDFSETNPSYHPVVAMGRNANVPSLPIHVPGTISLDPLMSESSQIYCSDCHSSDGTSRVGGVGPNGPHGSIYKGILRERYETTGGTSESYQIYALCYRCHDRDVILGNVSFKKNAASGKGGHSDHIEGGGGTSCSACHDPHGVKYDPASGDHEHLINFDVSVVSPLTGGYPIFTDGGVVEFSGSCTLICHGVAHDGSAKYSYP